MSDKTVADVLERGADKLEAPGMWAQGIFQKVDHTGRLCRCCAMGALASVSSVGWDAITFVEAMLPPTKPGHLSPLAAFNDDPSRTQPEVVAKLREAAALAREQGL